MKNEYCIHDDKDNIYYKNLTRDKAIELALNKSNLNLLISPVLNYKYYSSNLKETGIDYFILDLSKYILEKIKELIKYSNNDSKYLDYIDNLQFNIICHNYPKNIISILSNLLELIIFSLNNLDNVEDKIKDICNNYKNNRYK